MWWLALVMAAAAFIVGLIYGSLGDAERYVATRSLVRFVFWGSLLTLVLALVAWLGYVEGL